LKGVAAVKRENWQPKRRGRKHIQHTQTRGDGLTRAVRGQWEKERKMVEPGKTQGEVEVRLVRRERRTGDQQRERDKGEKGETIVFPHDPCNSPQA
jgi:hypothetical protein